MRSADIQIGHEYAYEPYKNARPRRVTVVSLGNAQSRGYGYRTKTQNNLVEVRHHDTDAVEYVRPQTIARTWEEQVALDKAARESAQQRATARATMLADRAALAWTLHQRLLVDGANERVDYVYRDDIRDALLDAGFEMGEGQFGLAGVRSTIRGLDAMLDKGLVPIDAVRVLLADETAGA